MEPNKKTDKEIEQEAYEAKVKEKLTPFLTIEPKDETEMIHQFRQLKMLESHAAQCGPGVAKLYNRAVKQVLGGHYTTLPGHLFMDEGLE